MMNWSISRRACWVLTGTFCGGKIQGTFATKLINCIECEFNRLVGLKEDADHKSSEIFFML